MKKSTLTLAAATLTAALSSSPSFALSNADLVGEPVQAPVPARVVSLNDGTGYVNVEFGDVVQFDSNGKSFSWMFDGLGDAVKLSEIAPGDFNAPNVTVYVNQATNPINVSSAGGE